MCRAGTRSSSWPHGQGWGTHYPCRPPCTRPLISHQRMAEMHQTVGFAPQATCWAQHLVPRPDLLPYPQAMKRRLELQGSKRDDGGTLAWGEERSNRKGSPLGGSGPQQPRACKRGGGRPGRGARACTWGGAGPAEGNRDHQAHSSFPSLQRARACEATVTWTRSERGTELDALLKTGGRWGVEPAAEHGGDSEPDFRRH